MSLDLEEGDEELAEATPAARRRAARKATQDGKSSTTRPPTARARAAADKVEAELFTRLDQTFDAIAKMLEARMDDELASVIREDKGAMSQGLVSLTRSLKFLRSPLLMALNLVEPTLAFGRVGRHLYVRYMERRERLYHERQQGVDVSAVAVTQ